MQKAYQNFNKFYKQSLRQSQIIKAQDLQKQLQTLKLLKQQQYFKPNQKQQLQKYIKTYTQSVKQINNLQSSFTKPSLINSSIAKIFNKNIESKSELAKISPQKNTITQQYKQQNQLSLYQYPSFKKPSNQSLQNKNNNEINNNIQDKELNSPQLRLFFLKKQHQIQKIKATKINFKDIIKNDEYNNSNISYHNNSNSSKSNNNNYNNNNYKNYNNNITSLSRSRQNQPPNNLSSSHHSSLSSSLRHRSHNLTQQFKRIKQQNRVVKQQYEKKLKLQSELNQFQKKLLKQEKIRYINKIEELQQQLENLYRENYKLKQQEEYTESKSSKSRKKQLNYTNNNNYNKNNFSDDFSNDINQNIPKNDYYQPYVMKTQQNDLKKLMNLQNNLINNKNFNNNNNFIHNNNFSNPYPKSVQHIIVTQLKPQININKNLSKQNPPKQKTSQIDILGQQLEKQIIQLQKQRSRTINNSKGLSDSLNKNSQKKQLFKKFQYNNNSSHNNSEDSNMILKDLDMLKQYQNDQYNKNKKVQSNNNYNTNNKSLRPPQYQQINPFSSSTSKFPSHAPYNNQPNPSQYQLKYTPLADYSFTKNLHQAEQYSVSSINNSINPTNYPSFNMTKTFIQPISVIQQQQSLTNKYIDSQTSTRNKVAFFKPSLILLKTTKFELAYKKSSLISTTLDRCRIIFFIKNKTTQTLFININYQYDAGYFKMKINQKIIKIPPFEQGKQDIQIYHYSQIDLNQVIDILVQVDNQKYGLWMPQPWVQFENYQNNNKNSQIDFHMPTKNVQEIVIVPDRQFKNYATASQILPLIYGGKDGDTQWAYLYGMCKFGYCYVKLTWENHINKQLKIQTHSKWIDLMAFVMHHVK